MSALSKFLMNSFQLMVRLAAVPPAWPRVGRDDDWVGTVEHNSKAAQTARLAATNKTQSDNSRLAVQSPHWIF